MNPLQLIKASGGTAIRNNQSILQENNHDKHCTLGNPARTEGIERKRVSTLPGIAPGQLLRNARAGIPAAEGRDS
jgi:hypothetical protein